MKYKQIIVCCLVAASMLAIVSCKKKKDESAHARLTGTWNLSKLWFDINSNSVMDTGEVIDAPYALHYTFNGDGTALYADSAGSFNIQLTWALQNNDADLVLKQPGMTAGSSATYHISTLTFSDLRLYQEDDSTHIRSYEILKKQ